MINDNVTFKKDVTTQHRIY